MENFTRQQATNAQNCTTLRQKMNMRGMPMDSGMEPQQGMTVTPRILLPDYHPDDEREYENDREYLMQMYPAKARIVMAMIERECDRLEYDGSPMYARYPDKETLLFIASGIIGRICGDTEDEGLEQLIQVLFVNECYNRRNKHRRRRKFY